MIDGSEKCNRQLAFELQNSHVCEKRSKFLECITAVACYYPLTFVVVVVVVVKSNFFIGGGVAEWSILLAHDPTVPGFSPRSEYL